MAGRALEKDLTKGLEKDLGETVGREAALEAAKQAAKESAKVESHALARTSALAGAKESAKNASKNVKDFISKLFGKGAKSAEKGAAKDAEKSAEESAEKSAEKTTKIAKEDVEKYTKLAAAAGLGLYLYVQSENKMNASNNTPRQITKVESAGGIVSSKLLITFTPAIKILKKDTLNFEGTQCQPSIDGAQSVDSVQSDSQITIAVSKMPTTLKPGGVIHVHTTIEGQAADSVGSAAADLGSAAGGVGSDLLSGLFGDWAGTAEIVGVILLFVIIFFVFIKK